MHKTVNCRKVCNYENTEKNDTLYFIGSDTFAPVRIKYHQSGSLAGFRYGGGDDLFPDPFRRTPHFFHDKLVLFHGIPRVVYTADHGTAVSHLQQLACDPHDHEPGILWIDAGFLLLFYEAVKSIPRTYSVKLLSAAVAFFRDYDDAYADG